MIVIDSKAFWRVGPDLLRVYGDIGLTAFPIDGPAAAAGGRYLACRAERDMAALMPLLPQVEPTAGARR